MHSRICAFFVLAATLLLAQDAPRPHVVCRVGVEPDGLAGFHFEIEIRNPERDELTFIAPYFAPGAYRPITVQPRGGELAWKQLKDFAAQDETGASRKVTLDGDRRWKVEAKGAKTITLRYRNADPSSRANNRSYLGKTAGLIDGPRSWLYAEGFKDAPCHVHFSLPEGWKVASGLDPTFDPMVFTAKDYDRLADAPTLVGRFHSWNFEVWGVPHRIVVDNGDREVRFDTEKVIANVKKIVETYATMWRDLPYEHYTFIYTPGGGGGLEHLTSTTIAPGPQRGLNSWLWDVTAHEHFHAWNVKRLRPFALGPFEDTGPVRVKDLWICEGLTSYYTALGVWRAGITKDSKFFADMGGAIDRFETSGGQAQRLVSPQESSWTVWDRRGRRISYYLQGEVLGLALDLLIRERSDNAHSLDDAMRWLYRRHGGYYRHHPPLPGYRSEGVAPAIKEACGVDVSDFFAAHIESAEPVDWNRYLGYAGWTSKQTTRRRSKLASALRRRRGGSGITLRAEDGVPVFRFQPGSPAEALGVEDGDALLAIDGKEVTSGTRATRVLRRLGPGAEVRLDVRREGKKLSVGGKVPMATELSSLWLEKKGDTVVIEGVPAGSAVARAGLQRGDVLKALDGEALPTEPAQALARLGAVAVGKTARISVLRDGQTRDVAVEVAADEVRRFSKILEDEDATPRQMMIRRGMRDGTTPGVKARVSR